MQGTIFDIQRSSFHDGPGIRTTVFLKGCPLRCLWCHNPESQALAPQLAYRAKDCTGCGACAAVCAKGGHRMQPEHGLVRSSCDACGACAGVCPNRALEIYGRRVSAEDILRVARQDARFYELSGGGITFSGGEPLMQADFLVELLTACHAEGFHTCVETSGFASEAVLRRVLPHADLFLYDYKATDPAAHRRLTGQDNAQILRNLRLLYAEGKSIRLRCPIIPGLNDEDAHFAGIAALMQEMPALEGVELLPYHDLGKGKAEAIGADYAVEGESATAEQKRGWMEKLKRYGIGGKLM